MNLALIAGLLFALGMPLQLRNPKLCDHAAPPEGMRWACASENPCDCHLAPIASEDHPEEPVSRTHSPAAKVACLACRIAFFVIPAYPEAARQGQKQGIVSALLIVRADGSVEEVRIQSGDPQLAGAARSAFQQWRFTPGDRPENIPVTVKFVLSDSPAGVVAGRSLLDSVVTATPVR